ncbi:alpha/beta hydrolase [Xanthobacteraceae bacterium A53D]
MPDRQILAGGSAAVARPGRRLAGLMVLAMVLLAACARPEGVLVPVSDAPPGRSIDMLVATTRAPSPAPGVLFSGERGGALALTDIAVSLPPERAVGTIQWPRAAPPDPSREFAVTRLAGLAQAEVPRWLATHHPGRRRVLVYVHGYNTRFDASVFGFAQFVADTDAALVPVLFSWPSRGRLTDYLYDRDSATGARSDLETVLTAATASRSVDEVVVLAHSMGAWLAVETLRQMALRKEGINRKITNLVLASPDLDIDLFERQMREMGTARPRVTIFVSRGDHALGLSRLLSGQMTRVGAVDLADPVYAARLAGARDITVFDVSDLSGGDKLGHSAFATQPATVRLIGTRLATGQKMDETDAASEVGDALAGSLPIRVFTGATVGAVRAAR